MFKFWVGIFNVTTALITDIFLNVTPVPPVTFHYVSLGICFCFDFWVPDVAVCTGPGFTEISPLRINSLCVAMELL